MSNGGRVSRTVENRHRIEYAQRLIEEMAVDAAGACCCGTIGIEIPIKDGKLGRVKRVNIVFEAE